MTDEQKTPEEAVDVLARVLVQQGVDRQVLEALEAAAPACPRLAPQESCVGGYHYLPNRKPGQPQPELVGRCPLEVEREIRRRVDLERQRLAHTLARANRGGGEGFRGYEPHRHPAAGRALDVLQRVAAGRPPGHGALLCGDVGLGKTRLLLACHLELLAGGVRSEFVTAEELRGWFYRAVSYEDEAKREAKAALDRYRYAAVVHLDDLGDIDGDERRRGVFAAGLKALLDKSAAVWVTSMNCNYEDAKDHPDIGQKLLSRLIDGIPADCVVRLTGLDQRLPRRPVSR